MTDRRAILGRRQRRFVTFRASLRAARCHEFLTTLSGTEHAGPAAN
jgi:hypothetical protein